MSKRAILIAGLALASFGAHADVLATMGVTHRSLVDKGEAPRNGKMNLTDQQGECPGAWKEVFIQEDSGRATFGCWQFYQGKVRIRVRGSTESLFEANDFTPAPGKVLRARGAS